MGRLVMIEVKLSLVQPDRYSRRCLGVSEVEAPEDGERGRGSKRGEGERESGREMNTP